MLLRSLLACLILFATGMVGFSIYLTSLNADPVAKPSRQMSEVWAGFPYRSHYVDVLGDKMHYIDEGPTEAQTFLFLHGNPTSSYLWRKVVPSIVAAGHRAVAVDNIGYGASDRPDIDFSFNDHVIYIHQFIEELELNDVVLVVHDWGSAFGFDYMKRHPDRVKGLVFMEAMLRVPRSENMSAPMRMVFGGFRTGGVGELMILGANLFVERALPMNIMRELSAEEHDAYREPFQSFGSRLPTLMAPREVPLDGEPEWVVDRLHTYTHWLADSEHPKLLLYADPGALVSQELAADIALNWRNIEAQLVGPALHYIQEDLGPEVGQAIVAWYALNFPKEE